MARTGRTLTRTMGLETRQHELLGMDFGEGLPRAAMLWGLTVCLAWWLLMLVIFRAPPSRNTFTLWVLPPVLLAVFGWRPSTATPRRRRVTEWVLAVRFVLLGGTPVVALGRGRRRPAPLWHRVVDRIGADSRLGERVLTPAMREASRQRTDESARGSARARPHTVKLRGRVLLVGTDTAAAWQMGSSRSGAAAVEVESSATDREEHIEMVRSTA